ncbi:sigma 54-interacting transcriptional regulator [Alkalihalobacterium alkalinitrilicum]|uniref:sigma 54-interacting transcriptional regulator n=1 Tax=Alkalihalobacterium alkalinitrilicum TaxID=427920 RepID=UPI00099510C7|nr:sigma 54-interacting transcriptional regulator [Alkalihalobacterium alkalinitrilicum]
MKLFVTGFSPLDKFVEEEISKKRKDFQELVVQKLEVEDILRNPTYIQNDDVLICGATVYEDFKNANVRGHLIPLRVQTNDFLKALNQAARIGKEINIINYKENFFKNDLSELEGTFNLKINQYHYPDIETIDTILNELLEKGQNTVIGSGLIVSKAISRGMNGYLWYGKESVKLAVDIAFNVLKGRFEEQSNLKRQEYILDNFAAGVISLNVIGRIIQINHKAIELLELENYGNLMGMAVNHIEELDWLSDYVKDNDPIKGKLFELKDKTLFLDSFPIYVKGNYDGSVIIISDTNELQQQEKKIRRKMYDQSNQAIYEFKDIVGNSEKVQQAIRKAKKFAQTDANVLIIGESGTGKELFAQSIHNQSSRANEPFLAINCAAVPENLIESELFGYSDGAFTGAKKGGNPGLFELAHNGTIFLDELGEIPLSMQSKLLRVLQENVVRRVGSATSIPIDVRIISATNANVLEQVKQGKFRLDLYYRISVLNLFLPSLNERKEDLEELVLFYTERNYPNYLEIVQSSIKEMKSLLERHVWNGNIREFENTLERLFAYLVSPVNKTKQDVLCNLAEALKDNDILNFNLNKENETYQDVIKEVEIQKIKETLQKTNGNKKEAAKILGMSRSTLWRKINEYERIISD